MWYLTFLAGGACEAGTKVDFGRRPLCKLNSSSFFRPSDCFMISLSFFNHLSHASRMRVVCELHVSCM